MKKGVSLLLVALLFVSSFGPMAYAEEAVTYGRALQEFGIISGDKAGNLNGDKAITRGELVAIISTLTTTKIDTFKAPAKASFSDVPTNHWAYRFVERAKVNNVTQGVGNGKFGINDVVTYKQAQAFMLNLLGYSVDWNTIETQAKKVGINCEAAVNATTFTRDMMFEVLWKSLMTPATHRTTFLEVVKINNFLDLEYADVDAAYDLDRILIEQNSPNGVSADDICLSKLRNSIIDMQIPIMTESDIEVSGTHIVNQFIYFFNNVTFSPSTCIPYYNAYKALIDSRGHTFFGVQERTAFKDKATNTYNDFVIEFFEDGSVTMRLAEPAVATIKFETVTLNQDSIWKSDGHPINNALTTYIMNLSHPTDKSINLKIIYTIDNKQNVICSSLYKF